MKELPKLLLVDDEPAIRKLVRLFVRGKYEVVAEASNGLEALRLVEEERPDIVLMDLDMPAMGGFEATKQIMAKFPEIRVVIASGQSQIESLKKAMAAGAREFLIKPFEREELLDCLEQLLAAMPIEHSPKQPTEPTCERVPGSGTWTVVGAGGGCGRTTFLLGMAGVLAELGHSVAVLDFDLLFGDLSLYLGLPAKAPDLLQLLKHEHYLETKVIKEHMKPHPDGFDVLTCPQDPSSVVEVDTALLATLTKGMEACYDFVLVDLPFGLSEELVALFDRSRFVFPVARMQANQLKNLKVMLVLLAKLGYSPSKLRPILTRGTAAEASAWIEQVHIDVARILPRDEEAATLALRKASPVTLAAPSSLLATSIRNFLGPILHRPPPEEAAPQGFLARMLG